MRKYYFPLFALLTSSLSFGQSACLSSLNDYAFQGPTNGVAIEKGDFDGDGILDLVVPNFTIGSLKINFLKGNGDATFDPPTLVEGGSRPSALRAGDYNGDGDLDLLVANFSPANVSLIFGNGNGTFQPAVNYTPGIGPRSIDIGDLNGDGAIDFVVGLNSGGFNVFLNTVVSLGTFASGGYFSMASATNGIKVADFNNDGNQDVATANEGGANVTLRFGNGAGSFGALFGYLTGSSCYEIGIGDFNADGLIDIASSNRLGNSISVLINTGAGVYAAAANYTCGESPYGLDIADLDNDGFLDIAVVNGQTNTLSVFKGLTGGAFLAHVQSNLIGNPRDLIIGNFDGNGNLDIAISTFIGQVVTVLPGNGTTSYPDTRTFDAAGSPRGIATADFNGDTNNDMIVVSNATNQLRFYSGNGLGSFGLPTVFSLGAGPMAVAVGDVNNNGTQDAVSVNGTAGTISVLLGNGSGSFGVASSFSCNANPTDIALADVNNDGNLDVLVTNTANQFSVLLGTGSGSFGSPTTYATGAGPTSIIVRNLNTDTFKDVVVTNGGTNTISVFMNLGSGTFGTGTTYTVQTAPSDADAGDIDNDGDLDLVISNFGSSSFTRYLNNGAGVFSASATTFLSAAEASSIKLGDFNLDGNLDVAMSYKISTVSTGIVALFLGNGVGGFALYNRFSTGVGPREIIIGNFSNDGRLDIAAVNETSNTFTVLLNNTARISAAGPLTFCTGSVNLTAMPSTSYMWSPSGSTQTLNVISSGNYFVTTTQGPSFWCSSTSNTLTVVNSSPPTPIVTASGPTTLCSGGSVTLTSSYPSNNTWSNGLTSQSITVSAGGIYTVTNTTGGCSTAPSSPITVVVNTTPTITASGPLTFCTGSSVNLTSSVPSLILWSNSATSAMVNITSSGTYTVSSNIVGCPALTSSPITVTVNSIPPTPTITASGATTFCSGNTITLSSSAGANNTWSNATTNSTLNVTASGSYNVVVNNAGCNSVPSNTIVVTVNPTPTPATITNGSTASFCQGQSLVMNSSLPSNNVWSTTATTPSITISSPATYTLSQVNGFGCSSTPASIIVTQNPLPAAPTVTASAPITFCTGNNVVLTSSYPTGNTWTPAGSTQNINVTSAGSYSVQHTNANGCVSLPSAASTIVVNPLPAAPTITALGPITFCSGGSVDLQSSQAIGNTWSNLATGQTIPISTPGNYSTTFTNVNGCVSAASNSITVSLSTAPATPIISASGPISFCDGDSVTLTSSETTAILWSNGSTLPAITVYASEVLTVTKTGGNSCTATSSATNVVVSPLPAIPSITLSGTATICAGETVTLTSSVAGSLWSNGLTTQSINITVAGDYFVYASTSGCLSASSDTSTIVVNPSPSTPIITASGPLTFCAGDSVQLSSSGSNNESWSNGMTGQSIWVAQGGNIAVTSTEVGGCSATSAPVNITINPSPIITVQNDPVICFSTSATAMTFASPAGGNYTGSGVIANLFFPTMAGLGTHAYTYSITNSVGCTGMASGNVIVQQCSSLDENLLESVKLYPNPNNGVFQITSDIVLFNELIIYDNSGKIVSSDKFESTKHISVDQLSIARGFYQVVIRNEKDIAFRFTIAVQN